MSTSSPDIFISYAREDKAWVQPLAAALEATGRSVFWDQRIPTGQSWHSYIGRALKSARCVVVIWSVNSVESEWVLSEVASGKRRGVLMPILKEVVEVPVGFDQIQAADLSAWRRGEASEEFTEFLAALASVLGPEPALASAEVQTAVEVVPASPEPPPDPLLVPTAASTAALHTEALKAKFDAPNSPTSAVHDRSSPTVDPSRTVPPASPVVRTRLLSPGDVICDVDEPWCPEMVIVPGGTFIMGSPAGGWFSSGEEGRFDDEGPQRKVRIDRAFALGRYTITRGQFASFVAATGHDMSGGARISIAGNITSEVVADRGWQDPGFMQTDTHPVVCVSWDDAQAYVAWLSEKTRLTYRLPTEAEWEYAARGGTATPFWTGPTISAMQANYNKPNYGSTGKSTVRQGTVAIDDRSFPANPFGLFHVHGNVMEWVQDNFASYKGAPTDGHVAVRNGDPSRVMRGGAWNHYALLLRSACRLHLPSDWRYNYVGFRVARMLTF